MNEATRRRVTQLLPAAVLLAVAACAAAPNAEPEPPATSTDPVALTTQAPSPPIAATTERIVVRVGFAAPIVADVADTDAERARGLMGRPEVPEGTGMAFRYPVAVRGSFYMFRTLVPLSIVWARDGKVVGVAEMTPCDSVDASRCERYAPPSTYDLAVETTGGFFTAAGTRVGDPVVIATAGNDPGQTPTGSPG